MIESGSNPVITSLVLTAGGEWESAASQHEQRQRAGPGGVWRGGEDSSPGGQGQEAGEPARQVQGEAPPLGSPGGQGQEAGEPARQVQGEAPPLGSPGGQGQEAEILLAKCKVGFNLTGTQEW